MATIRWSDASAAVSIYPTCILKVLGKMDKFNGGFQYDKFDVSSFRTRIVGVEGTCSDHYPTTVPVCFGLCFSGVV